MASIFTYQEEPPRVHSPWSTPRAVTPQRNGHSARPSHAPNEGQVTSITKLEPERHDGPTEYKLHLLLRSRRYQSPAINQVVHVSAQQSSSVSQAPMDTSGASTPQHLRSNNSRQARLQQLTTQLLWRLQQSSPFHSSSNADLVLPVLPEATPRLGVPDRPAKLLPGLEESQGALYEIGVADDGTLVGLVEEELEESLNNLRAMAASLGCVVDVLRRVLVAQYERHGCQSDNAFLDPTKIWVAEVLVRPDTKSPRIPPLEEVDATKAISGNHSSPLGMQQAIHVEQLRVAVIGATTAGKSSLVGTLTTSKLDNGRGKSRLSLLKHRHEIASGVTSSVAQELLGYRKHATSSDTVVNYATGDVSSWPDIHNLADRLVFLSDSPGLPRYAKSTFRTLVSWDPDWTLICVAADEDVSSSSQNLISAELCGTGHTSHSVGSSDPIDLSLAHLDICLKLGLPLIIVVTKLDIATKSGLKTVLSKILSVLKLAGKVPTLLGSPSGIVSNQDENIDIASELAYMTEKELTEVKTLLDRVKNETNNRIVPIILTSAVTGAGVGKLHTLLRELSPCTKSPRSNLVTQHNDKSLFHVDEIFAIPPSKVYSENKEDHSADQGIVLCGHVASGRLAVGDTLRLGPFLLENDVNKGEDGSYTPRSASYGIENSRRPLPRALSGLLSKSLQIDSGKSPGTPSEVGSTFLDVHVVSLRSLRLPVRSMRAGDTGTVGVQPIKLPSVVPLSRARKGMVLTSTSDNLFGYRSFSAIFPAADFTNIASPTLILGGHAIVYVNSVRAAVKVVTLSLEDSDTQTEPSSQNELFSFDGDEQDLGINGGDATDGEARITFKFVSSLEWMEVGNQVLVVPTLTAAGPVTGPPVVFNGLNGFVGCVCDVFT